MEPIVMRLAKQEDVDQLREVAIASFHFTFAPHNTAANMNWYYSGYYSREQFEKDLTEPDAVCYLACIHGKVVGFVRIRLNNEVEATLGKNTIELQRLYVLPDYQGKKVGSLLMKQALTYAAESQFEWIWLGVWEGNIKAQAFYNHFGFEKFGEHVFQMGDDPQIDWLLKRRLP